MENNKMISVVLPVRNGEDYIRESIESILQQTYTNFELIVIDDGSTDSTCKIINEFKDDRILLLHTGGIGLVGALNLGIGNAKGVFVARMDADDVSILNRFEKQVDVFNNKDIDIVFSDIERIDNNGKTIGFERWKFKCKNELINGLLGLKYYKPIVHPTVMIRTEVLKACGGYRNYIAAEDKDLWIRLMDNFKFHKINEVLLKYRVNNDGVSKTQRDKQVVNGFLSICNYYVKKNVNIDLYQDYRELLFSLECFISALDLRRGEDNFFIIKALINKKKYLNGVCVFVKSFMMDGLCVFPFYRRKRFLKNVLCVSDSLCRIARNGNELNFFFSKLR